MARALRWLATFVIGTACFAVAWWVCEALAGLDRSTAVTIATVAGPWLAAPAGWWATREAMRSSDVARSTSLAVARSRATNVPAGAPYSPQPDSPQPAAPAYPASRPLPPRGSAGILALAMVASMVAVAGGIVAILWLSNRTADVSTPCSPEFGPYCLAERSGPLTALVSSKTLVLIMVTVLVLTVVMGIWLSAWWVSLKRSRPPDRTSWQDPRVVVTLLVIAAFVVLCCCCGGYFGGPLLPLIVGV
ncbi:hypothetical protein HC028_13215 [Planosporangium flavigriseum]|uniref:hypothetical protein n=1 Tax=Planosporangium flavigriseum TaxID=373681 RepID=UPI00143C653A|nr:hypothetical protein [Planosporangium flavigriseum]NJC65458.1 hypothetical protein [Planosporangium flavigriseum]